MRAIKFPIKHLAFLLVVLFGSTSMCLYWSRITDAGSAKSAAPSVLKPNPLGDFYPRWYGARELLLHHRDPYGDAVNRELQIAYYGKELDPSRPEERQDQQRFAYPLYFVFLLAPLVRMEFHTVRIVFWWVLAVCAVVNLLLWLRFLRLRLSPLALAALFALVLTSIPVIQDLSILQPLLLAACFIAGASLAVVSGILLLAGALLAVATIKPQVCVLPIAWLALWVCSDWKHRRSLFWGFTVTLATLLLASECLLPGWVIRYPGVLRAYAEYTKATSFLGALLPSPWAWSVKILVLATVAEFCWRVRRQPADSTAFALALSLVLLLTVTAMPAMVQPFNHILLLPAVLVVIRNWRELWQGNAVMRIATSLFCLCTSLPWLMAIAAVWNPMARDRNWLLKNFWSVPLAASMALPFAAFGVLILLRKVASTPPNLSPACSESSPAASEGQP
jgi:hypothetical protein